MDATTIIVTKRFLCATQAQAQEEEGLGEAERAMRSSARCPRR